MWSKLDSNTFTWPFASSLSLKLCSNNITTLNENGFFGGIKVTCCFLSLSSHFIFSYILLTSTLTHLNCNHQHQLEMLTHFQMMINFMSIRGTWLDVTICLIGLLCVFLMGVQIWRDFALGNVKNVSKSEISDFF